MTSLQQSDRGWHPDKAPQGETPEVTLGYLGMYGFHDGQKDVKLRSDVCWCWLMKNLNALGMDTLFACSGPDVDPFVDDLKNWDNQTWVNDGEWLLMNWLMVNWSTVNDWWWIICGGWLMVNDWWWMVDNELIDHELIDGELIDGEWLMVNHLRCMIDGELIDGEWWWIIFCEWLMVNNWRWFVYSESLYGEYSM